MSERFAVHLFETAYTRRILFAAEIIDAVSLDPVTRGIAVKATGLRGDPIVNHSGFFVWLEEGGLVPQQVEVDASKTPYESITVPAPVPPSRRVRIELAPRCGYPFTTGVTAMRGTLIEKFEDAPVAIAGAETWLQWIDDNAAGTTWVDAPTHTHTARKGDFAAFLRLSPNQVARPHASGGLRVRLRVRHSGNSRTSAEFSFPQGRVADALPPFAWDELEP